MKAETLKIITVFLIIVVIAIAAFIHKKMNYITDVVISDEITIGPEWRSLSLNEPIVVNKDVNKFNIDPLPPFRFSPGMDKILGPDGVEFLPEVEITTDQGEVIHLPYSGGRFSANHNFVSFGRLSNFTKGQTISEIRVRSLYEIHIRTIWWSSYDAKDMP